MTTYSSIDSSLLFQSLHTPYIVCAVDDPMFTIIEENAAHAKVALTKRKDVVGRPLLEAFPDTSEEFLTTGISQLIESFRKVIRTKKPDTMSNLKYDLKDKQGNFKPKYWSVTHYPVIKKSQVIAIYQMTEDITDQVVAEQKLQQTEYQLTQALANGSIGTFVWDIANSKVYGDSNLARLYNLTVKQVKDGLSLDNFLKSIHRDDRDRVVAEIAEAVDNTALFESEYRTIDRNKDVRWVIARGRVEEDPGTTLKRFPGVVVDITERKNAENNISFLTRASTQFSASLSYKETLNNIASMVVPSLADWCEIDLIDDARQIEQVAVAHKDPTKVAWAKQLRVQQGQMDIDGPGGISEVLRTGKPIMYPVITDEMLVASAKNEKELALLRSLSFHSIIIVPMLIDKKPIGAIMLVSAESQVHYKPIDLEVAEGLANRAAVAVYNANLYQAAQQEIEEREWLQEQLETANDILESRVRDRTKQLEATNEGLEKEITMRKKTETVLQEYSKDLTRSNQELQDFAYVASHDLQEPLRKIQAFGDLLESEYGSVLGGGQEYLTRMRNAASRMSTLIEDLLAFSRVTTKAQPDTTVDLNVIAHDVVGDLEDRIRRTNGRVELKKLPTVRADPTHMRQLFQNLIGNALKFHREGIDPIVTVYTRATSDKSDTICVGDNGIGFDEKYLDQIFAVFQRLHGRETYDGTGIGLAVCRKIVERYDGTITAESKKDQGSTFIISLPKHSKETTNDN